MYELGLDLALRPHFPGLLEMMAPILYLICCGFESCASKPTHKRHIFDFRIGVVLVASFKTQFNFKLQLQGPKSVVRGGLRNEFR